MIYRTQRHPLKNFFLKKSIQWNIIAKIIAIVFLTSMITTALLAWSYTQKFQGGNFFFMSNDIREPLELANIIRIIIPALLTAQGISIAITILIALFSSRKAAVPIYKLERWAHQLKEGRLKTELGFRENMMMEELTIECNALAQTYCTIFDRIDRSLQIIERHTAANDPIIHDAADQIRTILAGIDYKKTDDAPGVKKNIDAENPPRPEE